MNHMDHMKNHSHHNHMHHNDMMNMDIGNEDIAIADELDLKMNMDMDHMSHMDHSERVSPLVNISIKYDFMIYSSYEIWVTLK